MEKFSHIDEKGKVKMVDITDKLPNERSARAVGDVFLKHETINQIIDDKLPKGNVLTTAKIAGIQAAKKCSDLIPLCHAIPISKISVNFEKNKNILRVLASCKSNFKTGVEMEALTAASISALTIYDMCKGINKRIEIQKVRLIEKTGGKSGSWKV